MIQQTSLEAYKAILPRLSETQEIIFNVIKDHKGMSNHDISRFIGWEINTVTPRVNELRDLRMVDCYRIKVDRVTGRKCMTWEII